MARKESEIPWMDDDLQVSTTYPEFLQEQQTDDFITLGVFVIVAVLLIALIFALAVFIDGRQEKLIEMDKQKKMKKITKLRIPKLGIGRIVREDEATIADKMQQPGPSSCHVIV